MFSNLDSLVSQHLDVEQQPLSTHTRSSSPEPSHDKTTTPQRYEYQRPTKLQRFTRFTLENATWMTPLIIISIFIFAFIVTMCLSGQIVINIGPQPVVNNGIVTSPSSSTPTPTGGKSVPAPSTALAPNIDPISGILTIPHGNPAITRVIEYYVDSRLSLPDQASTLTPHDRLVNNKNKNDESTAAAAADTIPPSTEKSTESTQPSPPPPPITPSELIKPYVQRMLVVSRHGGTTSDLLAMGEQLGFSTSHITWEHWLEFNRNQQQSLDRIKKSELIATFCHDYEIIAVSDVIWDGRVFLSNPNCINKLLFVTTNRFDILLENHDREGWKRELNTALQQSSYQYPVIVANNPYEQLYMQHNGINLGLEAIQKINANPKTAQNNALKMPIIRSLGLSYVPLDMNVPYEANPPHCVYYNHDSGAMAVYQQGLKSGLNHQCHVFSYPYGGPTYIRKFHAPFLYIPYQVSVMKMWESVRSGVIMLIPSLPFLLELIRGKMAFGHINGAISIINRDTGKNNDINTLSHYIDFYGKEFAPCSIQFSSWNEADEIVAKKTWIQKEVECRQYGSLFPHAQIVQWHKLLQKRFPHITLPPFTAEQKQAEQQLLL